MSVERLQPNTRPRPQPADRPERSWATWVGIFGGPVAWFLHLNVSYALVAWFLCDVGGRTTFIVVTVLLLAVAVAATVVAWRQLSRSQAGFDAGLHGTRRTPSFLAVLGFTLGVLSLIGIVYSGIPIFFLEPCGS